MDKYVIKKFNKEFDRVIQGVASGEGE